MKMKQADDVEWLRINNRSMYKLYIMAATTTTTKVKSSFSTVMCSESVSCTLSELGCSIVFIVLGG